MVFKFINTASNYLFLSVVLPLSQNLSWHSQADAYSFLMPAVGHMDELITNLSACQLILFRCAKLGIDVNRPAIGVSRIMLKLLARVPWHAFMPCKQSNDETDSFLLCLCLSLILVYILQLWALLQVPDGVFNVWFCSLVKFCYLHFYIMTTVPGSLVLFWNTVPFSWVSTKSDSFVCLVVVTGSQVYFKCNVKLTHNIYPLFTSGN